MVISDSIDTDYNSPLSEDELDLDCGKKRDSNSLSLLPVALSERRSVSMLAEESDLETRKNKQELALKMTFTSSQLPTRSLPYKRGALLPPVPSEDYLNVWRPLAEVPKLAFRFHDDTRATQCSSKGFRASTLNDTEIMVTPSPSRASAKFCDAAYTHLKPVPQPSPFVSVWQSLLPALHRGLRSQANPMIVIINLQHLYESQTSQIPDVHAASSVTRQLNLRKLQGYGIHFWGWGEWLIWGSIPSEYFLAKFTIADFRQHLLVNPELIRVLRLKDIESAKNSKTYTERVRTKPAITNAKTGNAIGQFLAFIGLNRPFIHETSLHIARVWRFQHWEDTAHQRFYLTEVYTAYEAFLGDELLVNDD